MAITATMTAIAPERNRALIVSFAVHGVFLVLLSSNMNFSSDEIQPRLMIQARLVDPASLLQAAPPTPEPIVMPEPVVEPEPAPVAPEVDEEALKREQERQLQKERDAAAQLERDRKAAEQRENERQAAEAQRKEQARRQAELMAALEAEEVQVAAMNSGDQALWVALVGQKVERYWFNPPSAPDGLKCEVSVSILPSGDVIDVRIGECNGDDIVRRSIESAVKRASPLPRPDNLAVFDRNLRFIFKPQQ